MKRFKIKPFDLLDKVGGDTGMAEFKGKMFLSDTLKPLQFIESSKYSMVFNGPDGKEVFYLGWNKEIDIEVEEEVWKDLLEQYCINELRFYEVQRKSLQASVVEIMRLARTEGTFEKLEQEFEKIRKNFDL